MWAGSRIYFLSDRDDHKRMNLYVVDLAGGQTRAITSFTDYDCKFPSLGDKAIVFENGGYRTPWTSPPRRYRSSASASWMTSTGDGGECAM